MDAYGVVHTYPVYYDSREMIAEYERGELAAGQDVIYRCQVCEVLEDFTDEDGERQLELLFKGGLGATVCG